ncbi:RNA-directed DNA polymerase (reverse transcriptase)-related family protein [Rhynchospora pubera]|uniref:RNA-directed DNA polymerase (Reverse transcriptase)-related family protein n=1 Tax=Rhynchospora pubera TaxID=906938 RepID=A0AAV8DC80_9POAL|nr:RNA-directed DNA polymerase (reverse transcriptase)-related family protein [Rhynchospora pubera]
MLDYKVALGMIQGLSIARNAPVITSVLYADDLLVCGQAEDQEVQQIKNTIDEFCAMSGQTIGIDKSRIWFSKRTSADARRFCMAAFQAAVGEKDHMYLGVPIMATRRQHYDYLIDKVVAKLHNWKAKLLSPAAKVVLVKSVVEPMVLYSMGAGPIPESVLQRINLKIRAFFWNSGDKNKMRLVSWEKITVPKFAGGLGLRDVTMLNKAMAVKMLWRLVSKECENSLWVKVLKAKYLSRSVVWLASIPVRCTKLWQSLLQAREVLKPHVRWLLGDGQTCKVIGEPWHDLWLLFLHNGVRDLNLTISDLVDVHSGGWNTTLLIQTLDFHRALFIACSFPTPPLRSSMNDRLVLKSSTSGKFSFKEACKLLQPLSTLPPGMNDIWKAVWRAPGMLPRTRIFLWKLLHDSVPLKAVIARRLHTVPPPCEVCGLEEDDMMHVLFKCEVTRKYWFSSQLAIRTDALPNQVTPTLQFLLQQLGEHRFAMFANLIWSLWKARCKQVYEGAKIDITQTLGMATSYDRLARVAGMVSQVKHGAVQVTVEEIQIHGRICTMDGSFKEGNLAGWAYMMYEDGRLVSYEMITGSAISPLHAEALAINAAMQGVKMEGWSDVTFYTDSQVLTRLLNGSLSPDSIDWRIYVEIVQLISNWKGNDGFNCVDVSRELLPIKHGLANLARLKGFTTKGFTFPLFHSL